ncbi:hypothetical protein HYZ97_00865 [Candidatus Pacearchaeota archaeon]|nr:hypothetical protein [Candidatus Pacearchaeota archaeon]
MTMSWADKQKAELYLEEYRKKKVPGFAGQIPLIAEEGTYYGRSLKRKLRMPSHTALSVTAAGIVGYKGEKPEAGERTPLEAHSLVKLVSRCFDVPEELVFRPRRFYQQSSFLSLPMEKQLAELTNAFTGCQWYDMFVARQKRAAEHFTERHCVMEWELNTVPSLLSRFATSSDTLKHLRQRGFIRDISGKGIPNRAYTTRVSNVWLAHLLSLVYERPLKEIWRSAAEDAFYQKLLHETVPIAIHTYAEERKIDLLRVYSISEGAKKIGERCGLFRDSKRAGRIEVTWIASRKRYHIHGFDLAVFGLKEQQRRNPRREGVAALFNIPSDEVSKLRVDISLGGNFNLYYSAFPLFDQIAALQKEQILQETSTNRIKKAIQRPNIINLLYGR